MRTTKRRQRNERRECFVVTGDRCDSLYDAGPYGTLPWSLVRIVKQPGVVILMVFLISAYKVACRQKKTEDGWVRVSSAFLCKYLGLTTKKEYNYIKKLKDLGFIECEMRGNPARRWVRIDFDAVNDAGAEKRLEKIN